MQEINCREYLKMKNDASANFSRSIIGAPCLGGIGIRAFFSGRGLTMPGTGAMPVKMFITGFYSFQKLNY